MIRGCHHITLDLLGWRLGRWLFATVCTHRSRVDEVKKVLSPPLGFRSGVWQSIVNGLTVQNTADTMIRTLIITDQRI